MLEGLDNVPWATFTHAYGAADDLPALLRDLRALLRDLRAGDPAARDQALEELITSITHQGSRYLATAPAVRFLAELVAAPDTPNRHGIMQLLGYAAVGPDRDSLPDGIDLGRLHDPTYSLGGHEDDDAPWGWPPTTRCWRWCRHCCTCWTTTMPGCGRRPPTQPPGSPSMRRRACHGCGHGWRSSRIPT